MRISDWSSDVCSSDLAGTALTTTPGRSICAPSTTTLSPGFRPAVTSQLVPTVRGALSLRISILFCAPTTRTVALPFSSRETAPCGTRMPLLRVPSTISARSEEHTSELQSLMRISYAVFCLNNKPSHLLLPYLIYLFSTSHQLIV